MKNYDANAVAGHRAFAAQVMADPSILRPARDVADPTRTAHPDQTGDATLVTVLGSEAL